MCASMCIIWIFFLKWSDTFILYFMIRQKVLLKWGSSNSVIIVFSSKITVNPFNHFSNIDRIIYKTKIGIMMTYIIYVIKGIG